VHWKESLRLITGEEKLNASALLEYFQPLYEYLTEENQSQAAAMSQLGPQPTILAIFAGVAVILKILGDFENRR